MDIISVDVYRVGDNIVVVTGGGEQLASYPDGEGARDGAVHVALNWLRARKGDMAEETVHPMGELEPGEDGLIVGLRTVEWG
jgi:hypothetical protein